MLKDIIQESPLYELAREYGEARGEARGLRNACLALTRTKAPRLVPTSRCTLTTSPTSHNLKSCSSIWALPRTRRPFSPQLANISGNWLIVRWLGATGSDRAR